MKDQIIAVLRLAKEKVQKGWIQGAGQSDDGKQVCAAQAIGLAAYEVNRGTDQLSTFHRSSQAESAQAFLYAAVNEQTGELWLGIPHWNDYPGRTQAEVVDAFDYAIKTVERELA